MDIKSGSDRGAFRAHTLTTQHSHGDTYTQLRTQHQVLALRIVHQAGVLCLPKVYLVSHRWFIDLARALLWGSTSMSGTVNEIPGDLSSLFGVYGKIHAVEAEAVFIYLFN